MTSPIAPQMSQANLAALNAQPAPQVISTPAARPSASAHATSGWVQVPGQPYQYNSATKQYRANASTGINAGEGYGLVSDTADVLQPMFKDLGNGQYEFVGAGSPDANYTTSGPLWGTLGADGYYYGSTPPTTRQSGGGPSKDGGLLSQLQGLAIAAPFAVAAAPGLIAAGAGGAAGTGGITTDSIAAGMTGGENAAGAMYGSGAGAGAGGGVINATQWPTNPAYTAPIDSSITNPNVLLDTTTGVTGGTSVPFNTLSGSLTIPSTQWPVNPAYNVPTDSSITNPNVGVDTLPNGTGGTTVPFNSLGGVIGGAVGGAGGAVTTDLLSKIAAGTMSNADWLKLLGVVGSTGLGIAGANAQQTAQQKLADQFWGAGTDYRNRLAASYADPNAFLKNSPDIQASVNQGTDAMARALSTKAPGGNTLQELQNYATNSLYGQLGNQRQQLANFGGLSAITGAAPGQMQTATNGQSGVYNAIGAGISNLTNPPQDPLQAYRTLAQAFSQPGVS